ncbi:MAG: VWA domain-containing protein, partial [Cyanobacteria bacterium]|nr:VWA domain-containing protein [Cyanobacteriota bacterium]
MTKVHERPVEPFSDIHCERGRVRATLLHDPTVEGLDMAIYLDGSGSMKDEYVYKRKFLDWFLGKNKEFQTDNVVEPQVRWILEYLATKDRNGLLRAAYWACGGRSSVELIGELKGKDVQNYKFPGPSNFGSQTNLEPALRDFVAYMREQADKGARQGCAVFVTDGVIHDADKVKAYCNSIVRDIQKGKLPRLNFVLVGVGNGVDEEQMEDICHEEYPGIGHLWCHRVAEEVEQVAELVAILVDESMTVASGGIVYDDKGKVLARFESRLPAILEFNVPEGCRSFTLDINGQRFTQPLPDDD